jgi:HlyD family secretion protein
MDDTTRVGASQGRSLRKVFLACLGAIVLLAAAGYGLWWWKFRDTLHYVTARVTRGDIIRSINMTGALNPVVTAQVGSYVSGNIKSWQCDYNTEVKIGQQCALIDPLPFQVIVDGDVADLNTSKAQLVKDKAALVDAKIVYERDKKLTAQGIVTQETLDSDKSTLDQDLATIDLDVATIASKAAALHAAQVNLDYTKIVSPVNGTVITRYIDVGYTVVSSLQSSTLFLIGKDMTSMQVDTNVSEADVGEVHDGQRANFTVQAYPNRTFEAKVRQIRKGPITVQNVVTYDVVLDVENKDLALLPGMTSDTHIITAERKNVLRVPLPATRFVPEGLGRAGRNGGQGAGARGAGAGVGSEGSDESPRGPGPSSLNDGLPGSGTPGAGPQVAGTAGPGAAGSGNATSGGSGDNNQQQHHHRPDRDQGGSGTGASGTGDQQWHHRPADQGAGPTGATGQIASTQGPGSPAPGNPSASNPGSGNPGASGRAARPDGGGQGGARGARGARGPRAVARIWVMRNGKVVPVMVRTGLDDGTLIEVWSEDLKEGDEVVVNAVRPNAPKPVPGERPAAAAGQGQPGVRGGGGAGGGFRL